MVAKSIAKMYTNIHKPTDYTVRLELSRMDSVTIKPSHSIRCVYRADLILLQIVD